MGGKFGGRSDLDVRGVAQLVEDLADGFGFVLVHRLPFRSVDVVWREPKDGRTRQGSAIKCARGGTDRYSAILWTAADAVPRSERRHVLQRVQFSPQWALTELRSRSDNGSDRKPRRSFGRPRSRLPLRADKLSWGRASDQRIYAAT